MTLSLATGLGWPDEAAKISSGGNVVPKVGGIPRAGANWRALLRVGSTMDELEAADNAWAEACHFDFVSNFDGSGAVGLAPTVDQP